jgi:hypothetical protein
MQMTNANCPSELLCFFSLHFNSYSTRQSLFITCYSQHCLAAPEPSSQVGDISTPAGRSATPAGAAATESKTGAKRMKTPGTAQRKVLRRRHYCNRRR